MQARQYGCSSDCLSYLGGLSADELVSLAESRGGDSDLLDAEYDQLKEYEQRTMLPTREPETVMNRTTSIRE
jgi:hypothetical protein